MTVSEENAALVAGPPIEEREGRLAAGADSLARRASSIVGHRNFLLAVAAVLMAAGFAAILLGWAGAADSTLVEEQLPYLISGGLLGLAMAMVGGLAYFAHWVTVLVRDARTHEVARAKDHAELMDALRGLRDALTREEDRDGTSGSTGRQRAVRRPSRRS